MEIVADRFFKILALWALDQLKEAKRSEVTQGIQVSCIPGGTLSSSPDLTPEQQWLRLPLPVLHCEGSPYPGQSFGP